MIEKREGGRKKEFVDWGGPNFGGEATVDPVGKCLGMDHQKGKAAGHQKRKGELPKSNR